MPLIVESPAKINLHLRIGPRQADGFHPLLSWMCTVALADTLAFDLGPTGAGIELACDRADLPADSTNLVIRAAAALDPERSARIRLTKRIPMGAGLGGGSSNAATTLVALNDLWGLDKPLDALAAIGATLGSDVPFFLHAPSAACAGRGQIVRAIAPPAVARWAVLILPDLSMPTPAVYRRFDEMGLGEVAIDPARVPPDAFAGWSSLPSDALLEHLINALEAPAFSLCPELGRLRRDAEALLERPVRMSGSGSSLFSLFDTSDGAQRAARTVLDGLSQRSMAVELAPGKGSIRV